MRTRFRCASLLIAFLVLPTWQVRRWYAHEGFEPVLVQLEMGRLATRTVFAIRQDNDILLPLSDFFDLSEIQFAFPVPGVVEAVLEPGEMHLRIDGASDSLTVGHRRIGIPANAVLGRDGEVFFSAALLGSLLNIRF